MATLATSAVKAMIAFTALPLLVVTSDCDGIVLRATGSKKSAINDYSCTNITKGQTWQDWKTKAVKLSEQDVFEPDSYIAIDHYVKWPWFLKGMQVMVCNPMGRRPNITWPADGGYSPVEAHCAYEYERCPAGLEIYTIQYQSWWPFRAAATFIPVTTMPVKAS